MAKKDLNNDLLAGGSISDGEKKSKAGKSKKPTKAKKGLARNQIKIIKSVAAVVVVLALLVTYVATGAVRKGFVHSTLQWTTGITGITIKSEDGDKLRVPVSTYNYYFARTYNTLQSTQSTYKQYNLDLATYNLDVDFDKPLSKQTTTNDDDEVVTWLEYLNDMVIDSIKSTYSYYNEAVKANGGVEPEITDEQKAELNETMENYTKDANMYGFTLSGYLVRAMGKGVTESVYRREAIRSYIAQNYSEQLSEEVEGREYTSADFEAYRDAHADDLKTVGIMIFEASNEDAAVEFKNALKADGSNFADLVAQSQADSAFYADYYKDAGASTLLYATKEILQNGNYAIAAHAHEEGEEHSDDEEASYPGLDWLFSSDRKAGDIYQYSTSVVYVLSPAAITDVKTVNVRHILITPETDDESASATSATAEQWAAALEKAQDVLKEFNNGDKTADSFAALAAKYSVDGSSTNGGLYENVVPGQMVMPFETWCFTNGRNTGDTGIVQSVYGYHVMYFDGYTDTTVWENTAQSALASDDANSTADRIDSSYTAKVSWFGSRYFEIDVDIDN